jgi:hypothetical protein
MPQIAYFSNFNLLNSHFSKDDGMLRTMSTEKVPFLFQTKRNRVKLCFSTFFFLNQKLLKTLPILQKQLDALVQFDVSQIKSVCGLRQIHKIYWRKYLGSTKRVNQRRDQLVFRIIIQRFDSSVCLLQWWRYQSTREVLRHEQEELQGGVRHV